MKASTSLCSIQISNDINCCELFCSAKLIGNGVRTQLGDEISTSTRNGNVSTFICGNCTSVHTIDDVPSSASLQETYNFEWLKRANFCQFTRSRFCWPTNLHLFQYIKNKPNATPFLSDAFFMVNEITSAPISLFRNTRPFKYEVYRLAFQSTWSSWNQNWDRINQVLCTSIRDCGFNKDKICKGEGTGMVVYFRREAIGCQFFPFFLSSKWHCQIGTPCYMNTTFHQSRR